MVETVVVMYPTDPGLTVQQWLEIEPTYVDPEQLVYGTHNLHPAVVTELQTYPNGRPLWVHKHDGILYVRDGRHRAHLARLRGEALLARVHSTSSTDATPA